MITENYTPGEGHQTPLEKLIYEDIVELFNSPISVLIDDLKDDPEAYDYTMDDLEAYLYKYNIEH